jgi:outer membrane protein TolC
MHRTLVKIVLISCFLMPAIARSQEVMDLQECLRLGLENNYELQITRNEALISDNNVTPGNAGFLPGVTLNSGYTFQNSNSDQFSAGEEETVQIRNANTGTTDAGVNLNWTLFEGFRVQTNYKRLKELQAVGELNARLAVENFIADLTAEYYNYVQQQIRLGNLQYAVALSRHGSISMPTAPC